MFVPLFQANRFAKSVLPSLCTRNGPSSCIAPYAKDEQPGPVRTYVVKLVLALLYIVLVVKLSEVYRRFPFAALLLKNGMEKYIHACMLTLIIRPDEPKKKNLRNIFSD